MRLNPLYSFEFNTILNEKFNEMEQIKNFASMISDKDRFFSLFKYIENNVKLIEQKMGSELPETIDFYVVRAEKFKSFSLPITIEYSLLPEEMIVFLLKEIVKCYVGVQFPDEIIRQQYVNSFVEHILINGYFGNQDFVKFGKNLHDESLKLYPEYQFKDIDFSKKTLRELVEEMYN